jgi:hypothetical protein
MDGDESDGASDDDETDGWDEDDEGPHSDEDGGQRPRQRRRRHPGEVECRVA